MEAIGIIAFLLCIGLVIIQIMMIIKFFEIAADIRVIKDAIQKHLSNTGSQQPSVQPAASPVGTRDTNENKNQDAEPNSELLDKDGLYKGVSGWPFAIVVIVAVAVAFVLLAVFISQK